MSECILHIGVEKTGSTSIQISMSKNRPKLLARGVLYPEAMGERNHVKTYAYASESGVDELKSQWGLNSAAALELFRTRLKEQLAHEVSARQAEIVCISNEHCSSRLLARSEIERLATLLGGLFSSVRVVAYLRRQGDALRSAYSTYVKTGGTAFFGLPDLEEVKRKYDYDAVLGRWEEVFGQANIDVRIFDKGILDEGDVVRDFLGYIGVDPEGLVLEKEMNISLGRTGTEFLRRFNAQVPYTVGSNYNPLRGNIQEIVEQFSNDTPYAGDVGIMDALDEAMAESNERVRQRYLPHMKGRLFEPVTREAGGPEQAEVSSDALVELMASIWETKQKQVVRLRERLEKGKGK